MKHLLNFRFFLTAVISLFSFSVIAQPVNDECSGAQQISHDASPLYYASTTVGATPSMGGTAKDVWFYFTATDNVLFVRLNNSPMKYEVFSGTCGNLSSLHTEAPIGGFCADFPDKISINIGQTYYLRVYFDHPSFTQFFQISLLGRAHYDECTTVTQLTMNYNNLIDTVTFASMMYSRINTITTMPFPFITTGGVDQIWFKFIATSTDHTVFLGSISYFSCWTGSSYPYVYAKYDGCTAADTMGTQTEIPTLFDSPGYVDFNSLTIGGTYYLRVWTHKMGGVSADFYGGVGPLGSIGQMPPPASAQSLERKGMELVVSPSPATSQLNICLSQGASKGQVTISDVTGREKYNHSFSGGQSIDINDYPAGIYFVRYTSEQGSLSTKFVKQ